MLNVLVVGHSEPLFAGLDRNLEGGRMTVLEDPNAARRCRLDAMLAPLRIGVQTLLLPHYQAGGAYLDAVETTHRRDPFHVVVPTHEYSMLAAAAIAARLGLRGCGLRAAQALTDKLVMRDALRAAGLACPWYAELHSLEDLRRGVRAGRSYVLKPANRHGSVGVQFINADSDLATAWRSTTEVGHDVQGDERLGTDRALAWRYMLEERLTGPEVSTEAVVIDGEIRFLNVTAKQVFAGIHPVMRGHVVPAHVAPELGEELGEAMAHLAASIEFGSGIMHAEWIVAADGPVLVECAGRLPGGSIVELIESAYEVSLPALLVMILAGLEPSMSARPQRAAAIGYLHCPPGRVSAIDGLEEARGLEGVQEAVTRLTVGDVVRPLRCSWDRVGHVRVTARDAPAARRTLARAIDRVRIITEQA
jgi:biotin carboxylase